MGWMCVCFLGELVVVFAFPKKESVFLVGLVGLWPPPQEMGERYNSRWGTHPEYFVASVDGINVLWRSGMLLRWGHNFEV